MGQVLARELTRRHYSVLAVSRSLQGVVSGYVPTYCPYYSTSCSFIVLSILFHFHPPYSLLHPTYSPLYPFNFPILAFSFHRSSQHFVLAASFRRFVRAFPPFPVVSFHLVLVSFLFRQLPPIHYFSVPPFVFPLPCLHTYPYFLLFFLLSSIL